MIIFWLLRCIIIHYRAVMGINYSVIKCLFSLYADNFNLFGCLVPLIVVPLFVFTGVFKFYLVPIKHIGTYIGNPPTYVLVVPDNNTWRAWQRNAVNIYGRGGYLHLVPDGWNSKVQVR